MKIQLAVAVGIMTMLAGCDQLVATIHEVAGASPMTVVIAPGMLIDVDGQAAKAYGNQECPREEGSIRMVFGASSLEGSKDCLVISPDTKSVQARLVLQDKLIDETWTVDRSGANLSKLFLTRPGNKAVMAYQR